MTPRRAIPIPVGPETTAESQLGLSTNLAPDLTPRDVSTQQAYRQLISRGVSSADAAALIGYVLGLAPCKSGWTLAQVNQLLFLRDLYAGDWGVDERRPMLP
jgi:hypothetical protein